MRRIRHSLLITHHSSLAMMNVTLRDLLRWPDCPLVTTASVTASPADREATLLHPDRVLSWPMAMRATPPLLPQLEEGALVLLPAPTLAEVRAFLPGALYELRRRSAAALIVDAGQASGLVAGDLDVLCARNGVTPDLELNLTRLINEHRTRLYRRGTEIDRALTEATMRGRGVADLLRIGAVQGGRPLLLLDDQGRVKEAFAAPGDPVPVNRPPASVPGNEQALTPLPDPFTSDEWLLLRIEGEGNGWLATCAQRGLLDEVDRLLLTRVAATCALALEQARRGRARLAPGHRAALVTALLQPETPQEERTEAAETLGLEPTATFTVLTLASRDSSADPDRGLHAARRNIADRLVPHVGAEEFNDDKTGLTGLLLHSVRSEGLSRATMLLRTALDPAADIVAALSLPASGLAELPEAARQARYALLLLRAGVLLGPVADWGAVDDLGPYLLLYPLWGMPEAARFVGGILGDLPEHDTRYNGELLTTLLTYLGQGGAAGAAADALKIHRNTLTYRLRRIEEICRRSPLDPAQQLSLHLAVLLHSLPAP
jgi:sugar diacid utilization regulator